MVDDIKSAVTHHIYLHLYNGSLERQARVILLAKRQLVMRQKDGNN
jgi:hypothetical protein